MNIKSDKLRQKRSSNSDIPNNAQILDTQDAGKKPGTTSGNEDYGSTEREPLDGHDKTDEKKPHI